MARVGFTANQLVAGQVDGDHALLPVLLTQLHDLHGPVWRTGNTPTSARTDVNGGGVGVRGHLDLCSVFQSPVHSRVCCSWTIDEKYYDVVWIHQLNQIPWTRGSTWIYYGL